MKSRIIKDISLISKQIRRLKRKNCHESDVYIKNLQESLKIRFSILRSANEKNRLGASKS